MISNVTQRRMKLFLITLFLAFAFVSPCTVSGAVWYVNGDTGASGDGTTWANALQTIQEAIDAASAGDEIWLKKGVYLLSSQIIVNKAVDIYGGFNGDEAQRNQRDWESNSTKIDGQGSVYHCLYVTADATIDGITITGGNADGSSWPDNAGGGIFNDDNSSATIINCTFPGNTADFGSGVYNDTESSPTITDCTFSFNSALRGGGMYNDDNSSPTITNCTFSGNVGQFAGGIFNDDNSSATITNCTFSANSATSSGGGMFNYTGSSPTITNCTFSGNSADFGGGIDNYNNSSPTITNCTFSGNVGQFAGGIFNDDNSSATITNCTFSGNSGQFGGGIYNDTGSSPKITNCILWGDIAFGGPEIANDGSSRPTITYCDIQGGYQGEGNIDIDPLFFDPSNNDFHLQGASPCIDTGNNSAPGIYTTDFEGDPRIGDGDSDGTATVDMGADEYVVRTLSDGDVAPLGSRDSKVNVGDALVALRFALGLEAPTSEDIAHGDVAPLDAENKPSPDGVINVGDALVILRKALGIISF